MMLAYGQLINNSTVESLYFPEQELKGLKSEQQSPNYRSQAEEEADGREDEKADEGDEAAGGNPCHTEDNAEADDEDDL